MTCTQCEVDAWCRGSNKVVPGVNYGAKKPTVTPLMAWRAAVESSHSASELAMHLRAFDAAIQWDAIKCACFCARSVVAQYCWPISAVSLPPQRWARRLTAEMAQQYEHPLPAEPANHLRAFEAAAGGTLASACCCQVAVLHCRCWYYLGRCGHGLRGRHDSV